MITSDARVKGVPKRVGAANDLNANFFLSIHHDSVPDKMLEDWEFEGKKGHFSDRFSDPTIKARNPRSDCSSAEMLPLAL
jgi:N-acetylmuramoyl-L-alanine amidase